MLNRQDQRVLPAAEGERRIHPGKEIARTAQAQPTGGRAILAGMMDDNDRHVVSALQGAQVAENRGHLARLVFVHLMQADKGVENKQTRRLTAHGFGEAMLISQQIQAHRGRSEEHTSELQSLRHLVCRLLLEKKKAEPLTTPTR